MGSMLIRYLVLTFALICLAGTTLASAPKPVKLNTTADHSKFKALDKEFGSGPEVPRACLSCHTEAAGQRDIRAHQGHDHRLGKARLNSLFSSIEFFKESS